MDQNVEKVYENETIQDQPFPVNSDAGTVTETANLGSESGGAPRPGGNSTIPDQPLPALMIASELLSQALNTRTKKIIQEFGFAPSGAIQIGTFKQGVNGDIRISPEGIVGRDNTGQETFAIDSETGDAVFSGKIQGQSLVAGVVNVGDGNIQVDGINKRMLFFDNTGTPVIVIGIV